MMKTTSPSRRTARTSSAMERFADSLVQVGAPLMLALSSLSVLAVMLLVHEVPSSVLVPLGGLAAAALLFHWGQRQGERND